MPFYLPGDARSLVYTNAGTGTQNPYLAVVAERQCLHVHRRLRAMLVTLSRRTRMADANGRLCADIGRRTIAIVIARLDLRSFKAFERFTANFRGDAYMVGPNNAGKSTLVAALRAAAHMLRYASARKPALFLPDGAHGLLRCYGIEPDQFGLVTENIRHEFRRIETRLEVGFANKAILRAVWPGPEEGEEDQPPGADTGFFYLISEAGIQPSGPSQVRRAFPSVGVVPVLSPLEHRERPLSRDYLMENLDGRLASRHFRNQLALLRADSEHGFQEFLEFASEWAPEIEIQALVAGASEVNLFYKDRGRHAEKEIFWAGDGYQVWLQLLLHLFRLREAPCIVLDEPDVFLHADLQRRLVRLLESFKCQVVTATHSPEMLTEAPPESVVWVDKSRARAIRAPHDAVLSNLADSLGSHFNLRLAKALRSKVVLFVEGDDMKILKSIAGTIGASSLSTEIGIAIVPLRGFSHWEHVEPFSWLLADFLEHSVTVFVVLDRDYRTDLAGKKVLDRLRAVGVRPHIWERKELESYLIVPSTIARLSGASEAESRRALKTQAKKLRGSVFVRMQDEYLTDHKGSKSRVTLSDDFMREFDTLWLNEEWRLSHCPPKDIIAGLNTSFAKAGRRSISARSLARAMRPDEIPEEMVALLQEINRSV